jgi:outer membrane protein, multidrug efflux system
MYRVARVGRHAGRRRLRRRPDYRPSAPHGPARGLRPLVNGLTDQASAPSSWWASFNDAELDSLIERAVKSNLDLRVAEARLRQARAVRGGSAADLLARAQRRRIGRSRQAERESALDRALPLPPTFPFEYSVYQVGFDASWEIDLFGGKRRALEAATADWQGAIEARNDAM